jgi:dTDP-4-dehydrorhamnose 3,5-epimerase-like enzyme
MNVYNIYRDTGEHGLGRFVDQRGSITDIFYGKNINHANIITCFPNTVRGNHYHNLTTQYTYILSGQLYYYARRLGASEAETDVYEAREGDVIISDPLEIHAMIASDKGCTFLAFAEGPRGGKDYESDTVRVPPITPTTPK